MNLRTSSSATLAVAALVAGTLAVAPPVHAAPDGSGLVISEVYGGGGNSGATWKSDFVELYNPTAAAIVVDGWSLQGRSATNTSPATAANTVALSGVVPAGGHYLVKLADGAGGTKDLPAADATGSIAMGAAGWQMWVSNGTAPLDPVDGDVVGTDAAIVDLVGAATTSASFEAVASDDAISATVSAQRVPAGTDSDDNAADFAAGAPTPTNAAGETEPPVTEPPAEPTLATIAQVQGTDADESPMKGATVTTEGVVTAAYPVGGFYGFYLQTAGTGGPVHLATHRASDALFVHQAASAGAVTVVPGDHVRVTGTVTEYAGATQVDVAAAADIATLPAADPIAPVTSAWPATDEQKESLEGMLFDAAGDFTVTNTYATNQYGEVGLATGDTPLIQPTEVAEPGSAEADAVAADNAARGIVLDDGSSWNYLDFEQNRNNTPPYVSNQAPLVVGAPATFTAAVILTEGGSRWNPTYRFQPTAQATDDTATWPVSVTDVRTTAPDQGHLSADGTPELKVASFNVLNYFTTLGDADDDNIGDGGCEAYEDRDGDGNNVRRGCDLRGAWDPADLARQQEKIVAAITALDADVVGLMEIENSAALGEETDEATRSLVDALNAAAGAEVWAANPSSTELPAAGEQDVITNAIIYKVDAVDRVGPARALDTSGTTEDAFQNAREPIGQVFAPAGGGEELLFVVNHFKSKGSVGPWPGDVDAGDGQGNSNESRVRQATALRDWVTGLEAETGVDDVLLVGDFNAYTAEDPLQVLYDAGYVDTETHVGNDEYSYSYSGLSGSLDHVLANPGALDRITGADIWNINAGESVALEYSRYNYHATDFHTPEVYRSSDHDPVVVGLRAGASAPEPEPVDSTTRATVAPKRIVTRRTRARVVVTVQADGAVVTGTVTVRVAGETYRASVDDGTATVRLKRFKKPGTYKAAVRYLGTDTVEASRTTIRIRVASRRR